MSGRYSVLASPRRYRRQCGRHKPVRGRSLETVRICDDHAATRLPGAGIEAVWTWGGQCGGMDEGRLNDVVGLIAEAEKPVRVLRHLAWPASVRESFLAGGGKSFPKVSYEAFDAGPSLDKLRQAREALGEPNGVVGEWLSRLAENVELGARMVAATGTSRFYVYSRMLFGAPRDPLPDGYSTALALSRQLREVLDGLVKVDLGPEPAREHSAEDVADYLSQGVRERFGDEAPLVELADELSANALAGPRRIRVRRDARFTDRDMVQLLQHEAFVHVATSLNGRTQEQLPILAASHPGTTRTQEGLAVFAEFISGAMELDRLRRLTDRIEATQMAIDGADFLEVFRFFRDKHDDPEQAFENCRRIFRGGMLAGGAPFTKDIVYLDGLLRVHNFLRSVVAAGRADLLRLLFCGKLDIDDIPALAELASRGLCRMPTHFPPWAEDLRYLLSYLAYSGFLNTVKLDRLNEHYSSLIAEAPVIRQASARGD